MIKGVFSLLLLLTFWQGCLANPSCPKLKPGMINVHLVCHTHDDVGWLKTLDQYFYGAKKKITWVGVQYIIDSVVPSLLKDPSRKFIYVESAFFWRWWNEQDEQMQSTVKKLVESGQLEFISGGWSMNDEAAAHYNDIIDQMTIGLVWLNETFGPSAVPRIAWQIDPFGHSKEQASLFAQMGLDGLFFGRLDYDDKRTRWRKNEMEMVWKGSNSLGEDAWLFTGVLPNGYSPPKGFCFDLLCSDDPIMDDPSLEDYNKDEMVDKFLATVKDQKTGYATSNLIMTMGEDFDYVYAEAWYKNLDKLIKYVNERQKEGSNVNVVYSTPSCYLDALHDADLEWPTKTDDFFPYASDPHAFWTGYFTSRPTLKGYVRQSNNLLQAIKQMAALTGIERGPSIDTLSKAMAVLQHHDAITGTAKQHVTDDYYLRLSTGVDAARPLLTEGFRLMTQSPNELPKTHEFTLCPLLNISSCALTETSKSFVVNVYNPLARSRSSYVRAPVVSPLDYKITDEEGNQLESQLIPIPEQVLAIPGRKSAAKYELVFHAEDLPPLAAKQFLVSSTGNKIRHRQIQKKRTTPQQDPAIKNGKLSLVVDANSKKLKSIGVTNGKNFSDISVSQDWLWYAGMKGNNAIASWRASGAYIFRPDGIPHLFTDKVKINGIYDGPLVQEIHQEWSSWLTQVFRLHKNQNYVEAEWLVGPIPIKDGVGKEVITRLQFEDMATDKTFYTDANGREMQKRIKNYRETWTLNSTEPVSQNYYPVTSRIILQSTNGKGNVALMNDRAQGGSSLSEGEVELMVHRRLLYDDAFGVGEALNEMAYSEGLVARGKHFLLHSKFATEDCDFGCMHRTLGEEILLQPIVTFSSSSSFSKKSSAEKKCVLKSPLPANMRILTLEPWRSGEWLLRLENFYEKDESSLSGTSTVDIQNLFTDWSIADVQELALGANQLKKDTTRLHWKTSDEGTKGSSLTPTDSTAYSFAPMQIRTFVVKVTPK